MYIFIGQGKFCLRSHKFQTTKTSINDEQRFCMIQFETDLIIIHWIAIWQANRFLFSRSLVWINFWECSQKDKEHCLRRLLSIFFCCYTFSINEPSNGWAAFFGGYHIFKLTTCSRAYFNSTSLVIWMKHSILILVCSFRSNIIFFLVVAITFTPIRVWFWH